MTSASVATIATGPTTSTSSTSPRTAARTRSNVFQGYFGSQVTACTWRSDKARLGDNWNLEYLCIDACNSLELSRNVIADWQNTFQGLHQIFAFTDVVSDSWWTGGRGYGFGRRAGNNEVLSNAWLDECYSFWCDDNPVAMAAGPDAGRRRQPPEQRAHLLGVQRHPEQPDHLVQLEMAELSLAPTDR